MKTPSFEGLTAASETAARAKRANRSHGTKPEQLLRRSLWQLGLRYRKNVTHLPGRPDVVFMRAKVAVFCDGDFWHGRNWLTLKEKLDRGWNASYWTSKIARNIERDHHNTELLQQAGWRVIRIWESDIKLDPLVAAYRVRQHVHQCAADNSRTLNLTAGEEGTSE